MASLVVPTSPRIVPSSQEPIPSSQEPNSTQPATPESNSTEAARLVRRFFESPLRNRFSSQSTQIISSELDNFPSSQEVLENLSKATLLFSSQKSDKPLR